MSAYIFKEHLWRMRGYYTTGGDPWMNMSQRIIVESGRANRIPMWWEFAPGYVINDRIMARDND